MEFFGVYISLRTHKLRFFVNVLHRIDMPLTSRIERNQMMVFYYKNKMLFERERQERSERNSEFRFRKMIDGLNESFDSFNTYPIDYL